MAGACSGPHYLCCLCRASRGLALAGILSDTASNFLLIAGVIVLILILAYFVILSKRR